MRNFKAYGLAVLGALAMILAASLSGADTAVSACGTLSSPGRYFLTKSLTSSGTCITIGADGISLDMKGKTLTGNGTGDGISDGGGNFESMAIANGTVSHFSVGIDLNTSCCVVIREVTSSNNTSTGILLGKCCGTLDSVTVKGNGADGVDVADGEFTLHNITVKNNSGSGINIGCCTLISDSVISGNSGDGVFSFGGGPTSWFPAPYRITVPPVLLWVCSAVVTSSSAAPFQATWVRGCYF